MVHICHTAHKRTGGCLTIGQLAPHDTPHQQEEPVELQQPKLVEPQQEESLESQEEELAKP
jgi:hypothetical protein